MRRIRPLYKCQGMWTASDNGCLISPQRPRASASRGSLRKTVQSAGRWPLCGATQIDPHTPHKSPISPLGFVPQCDTQTSAVCPRGGTATCARKAFRCAPVTTGNQGVSSAVGCNSSALIYNCWCLEVTFKNSTHPPTHPHAHTGNSFPYIMVR